MFLILPSGLANQKMVNVLLIEHVSRLEQRKCNKSETTLEAGSTSKRWSKISTPKNMASIQVLEMCA